METFFEKLNFRRFQVDLTELIEMDDTNKSPKLTSNWERMGRMILYDQYDRTLGIKATQSWYG